MSIEITEQTPRTTLTGNEQLILYDPTGVSASDKLVLADADLLNTTIVNDFTTGGTDVAASAETVKTLYGLVQQLADLLEVGGIPGGGTGSGGTGKPSLPATWSLVVPTGYEDDWLIGYVPPLLPISPIAVWSIPPSTVGLSIRSDTGDLIVTDAEALHEALADSVTSGTPFTVTVTAANTGGAGSTVVTITPVEDYDDTILTEIADNITLWLDFSDNEQLDINAAAGTLSSITSKDPEERHYRMPTGQLEPAFTYSSQLTGRPALRANGNTANGIVLWTDEAIWQGLHGLELRATGAIVPLWDGISKDVEGTPTDLPQLLYTAGLPGGSNDISNKALLVTLVWTTEACKIRINGTEVGTIAIGSYWQPQCPGMAFFVLRTRALGGVIMQSHVIAQTATWRGAQPNCDIGQMLCLYNVVEGEAEVVDPEDPAIPEDPVVPAPLYPDETVTGYTTVTLVASPAITANTASATITGKDITGSVHITANDVTVTNCRITSDATAILIDPGVTGTTIEYCDIISDGTSDSLAAGIEGTGTFQYNDISGFEIGIKVVGDDAVITENYIHDLSASGSPAYYGVLVPGDNTTVDIIHNSIQIGTTTGSPIKIANTDGDIDTVTVDFEPDFGRCLQHHHRRQ